MEAYEKFIRSLRRRPIVWFCAAVIAAVWCRSALVANVDDVNSAVAEESAPEFLPAMQSRRPVDFAMTLEGDRLIVVNSDSGTASVVDTRNESVIAEHEIGEKLSAIEIDDTWETVLITDEANNELIVADFDGMQLEIADRIGLPVSPVDVASDGKFVVVACKWSRRVVTFHIERSEGETTLTQLQEIPVSFEPGRVVSLGVDEFLVADAFGGELLYIDFNAGKWRTLPGIKGHNIAGITLSCWGSHFYISHQFLNPLASTTHDDVQWGALVENMVQTVTMEQVRTLPAEGDSELRGEIERIGEVGRGAGDPAGIASYTVPPGREARIVALSGVDELLVETDANDVRIPVGDCPTQVVVEVSIMPERHVVREAYVLNMLDDSISVIDLDTYEVKTTISLGPRPPVTPAQRGESLFRDATLSLDGWLSCHSCHTDGHTNGLVADTTSDGSYQTPKAIPSLLGTRDANPWAWNGSFRELHQQVRQSVVASMQGTALSAAQEQDIVAFLHTLRAPPPLMPPEPGADAEQVARGEAVFRSHGCAACHVPPLTYTSDAVYDVGLSDESGLTKFNPPTLRGVSHRRRLLHDLRAGSLEEVFTEHDHMAQDLDEQELTDLVRFLQSL
jgi:YVTN family beta-propeller protein